MTKAKDRKQNTTSIKIKKKEHLYKEAHKIYSRAINTLSRQMHVDRYNTVNKMNTPPRILYSASLSFIFEVKTQSFMDSLQLREFIALKQVLQEALIELL